MKAIHIFLLLLIFSSCKSDYVRALDDFQGTWQIQSISYFDGNQKVSNTGNLGVLTFGEEKVNQSDGLNRGTQTVDNWSVGFQYSFVFSNHQVDISLFGIDRKTIPVNAVGRVQVYNYEKIDKNTLRIFTDNNMSAILSCVDEFFRYKLTTKVIIKNSLGVILG